MPTNAHGQAPHWEQGAEDASPVHMGFHHSDGLFVQRFPNGDVRVCKHEDGTPHAPIVFSQFMPENEWASIVASTFLGGETRQGWMLVRAMLGTV